MAEVHSKIAERFAEFAAVRRDEVRQMIIKETARGHVQTEKAVDEPPLIELLHMPWCCLANDEARELILRHCSVYHKSQLFIPGDRNNSDLQGILYLEHVLLICQLYHTKKNDCKQGFCRRQSALP
jgi:hypothetical protein